MSSAPVAPDPRPLRDETTSPAITRAKHAAPIVGATGDAVTSRSRAKATRRRAILNAAADLFAERGYNGVSIEDLGTAVGVSGPAVYRHFAGKQAVLASLLVGVSEGLAEGGRHVLAAHPDAHAALTALIEFHVDFALVNPAVIRVQDRDFTSLDADGQHTVRVLQRGYVELWVEVLHRCAAAAGQTAIDTAALRVRAHAIFGLINSTPYSVPAATSPATQLVRETLIELATRALAC